MFTIEMTHHKHSGGTKEYYFTSVQRDDGGASLAIFQWGKIGEGLNGKPTIIECPTAREAETQVRVKMRAKEKRGYTEFQAQTFEVDLNSITTNLHCFSRLSVANLRHLELGYTGPSTSTSSVSSGPISTPEPASPPPVASVEELVKKNANWGMF